MLSICIPTYRYDVRPLVTELLRQVAAVQEGPIEILVFDDASPDDGDWGRAALRQTSGIRYEELTTNLGRAAIRNKMARAATQEFLVMMDADGWPNPNFVRRYLNEVKETKRFPEDVDGYGHEDTVWGQQFASKQVSLYHEDNPVVHLGLEPNDVFLRKQKQAIENLRLLKNRSSHLRTRLIDLVEILPFLPFLASLFPEKALVSHLTKRARPSLYALDLLKLRWWRAVKKSVPL